jgi:ParB-like chromosome segregation protein Spo0J
MSLILERDKLTTRSPFRDLFPIDKDVLAAITESVRERFDSERPIVAWKKNDRELIVVDGHTRLEAARKARLKQVPVVLRKFPDERAALEYAIAEQRNRRNMSREEQAAYVLRVVEALDQPAQGKRTDLDTSRQAGGKSGAERTAELAGVSTRTVERARRVKDSGDEQVKQAVRNGKLTLPAAEKKVKASEEPDLADRRERGENSDLAKMVRKLPPDKGPPASGGEPDWDAQMLEDIGETADSALSSLKVYANEVSGYPYVALRLHGAIDALDWLVMAAEDEREGNS